eukprot:GHUV01031809.1.p1 GENE.GHUV01031809.1~~GHUV01031809.1.p1  ORF type:complete len:278 (+),score=79.41 GHUV01031809.1:156-989(+)
MLTDVTVPAVTRLRVAAETYKQHHSACYYADLLRAHAAVGLLRQVSVPAFHNPSSPTFPATQNLQTSHIAWGFASLVPYKDMEVCVVGNHLCCPAFQKMLHAALRAVIDGLGCRMFNVGALNIDLEVDAPAGVGMGRQFWNSSNSGLGGGVGTEGVVGSSGSNTLPDLPHSASEAETVAQAAGNNEHMRDSSSSLPDVQYAYTSQDISVPDVLSYTGKSPVIARLVSRGKLSAAAVVTSDFGGLEVFGGASIGHTDPFLVAQQLDLQLSRQQYTLPN